MAKPKQEIQPDSGKRLKQLCSDQCITQEKLSEIIGISTTTISKIACGKSPLSYRIACLITDNFPDVRVEWLMGTDEYKTEKEKLHADRIKKFEVFQKRRLTERDINNKKRDVIEAVCALKGIVFKDVDYLSDGFDWGGLSEEQVRNEPGTCSIFNSEGKEICQCSISEHAQFERDILDFADYWIDRLLRREW